MGKRSKDLKKITQKQKGGKSINMHIYQGKKGKRYKVLIIINIMGSSSSNSKQLKLMN